MVKNLPAMQEMQVQSLGLEDPPKKEMATHSSILPGESPWTDFPGGSDGKESACNVGDPALISGSGRSPREGNGNPLQCSSLENSMDRGAW